MAEFRTEIPASKKPESSSGGSDFGKYFDRAIENIKNDPQAKAQVAQALQEQYNIPPQVLASVFPEGVEPPEQEAIPENPSDSHNSEVQTEVQTVTEKPSPEQVRNFLGEIIDLQGPDMTLGELKDFAENNPDILETAIEMKF